MRCFNCFIGSFSKGVDVTKVQLGSYLKTLNIMKSKVTSQF